MKNYLYDYAIFRFLPKGEFKWIVPKDFYLNQYNKNSSTGCLFKADLSKRIRII